MLGSRTQLNGLKNIGPTIAERLAAVGIRTVGDLRRRGPAAAYHLVKANNPGQTIPVCYYLYSLQGALDGVAWDDLPEKKKRNLLSQVQAIHHAIRPSRSRKKARFG